MEAFGWAGGYVHEIAVPLFSTQPRTPSPPVATRAVLTNGGHGQPPGAANSTWLYAKVFTHPDRINEIIASRIPHLLQAIGSEARWWFVRYRNSYETDHIRLRLATADRDAYARSLAALGDWGQQLRADGVAGRLAVDTYLPEIGRYGCGVSMTAAENVFAADSAAVAAQLRHDSILGNDAAVGLVLGLVDIVAGFLGGQTAAMTWLRTRPVLPGTATADRAVLSEAIRLVQSDVGDRPGWTGQVAKTWTRRAAALAAYRTQLSADTDSDAVLESLLHMHHNRAAGVDRDAERATRRMARHLALAVHARQPEASR
ncbi:thiopeptide-type bacteriocin biosynthesis protein [Lentzea sp. E54]|uniref:thiopeptide-type bacteriocin biosynthesis protein n=1 Tax=Lentzea xerophila TaxID=3435883 RepID=UPI003DA3E041